MKKFIINRQFQMDFRYFFNNKILDSWESDNKSTLDGIGEKLKYVKFENYKKDTCTICGYICKNFSSLFQMLWKFKDQKLERNKEIEEYTRKMRKYYDEKTFSKLKNYKYLYDTIIYEARMQRQLDIRIEGKDCNYYWNFSDAKKLKNGIYKTQTNTIGSTSMPKTTNSSNSQVPILNFQREGAARIQIHKKNFEKQKSQTLPTSSKIDSKTSPPIEVRRGSRDSLDEQFLKTLKSQEARFEKELREKREEREARKIKAYQELIRLRKESRARLQAFMACLELKIRWEQQEQDWSDWLKDTRAPLIRIKTKFTMFSSKWRRTDEDENKEEALYIQNLAQEAYYTLVFDFEMLQELAYKYLDKLFLKVLQKQISQVATKLCNFIEELGHYENDKESFARIQNLESHIDPLEIPSTTKLRLMCETEKIEDYSVVAPPKVLKSSPIITEED
ncbi:DUF713 domain-containing protein [Caenorhabditis elegans]|uniref:Uncharacterized protein n=1 Tax=Caenorhabditis elegans TaxID=6239 RepID=Q9XXT8_CAEEL|nr:Uncharacterized protein CELE_Y6E2A.5 [Caenorhabditis elegans]CAA15971.2 Uncharacterized protein CELE_Y6E2A.5 [Caenorhabditis elegans]|eukprot:NP_506911.2 Uncharacterized protein CELE_Y6E2A.5 [Caenorhabditis elegans]